MNLHEYQSKRLFADYGIPVPRGIPVKSPNAAVDAAKEQKCVDKFNTPSL